MYQKIFAGLCKHGNHNLPKYFEDVTFLVCTFFITIIESLIFNLVIDMIVSCCILVKLLMS
uniref:Uncharacterized protein n=1 Tax=Rhizophora mucronata TaxID=61149 RepID=A0A2P2QGL3_RHIMU